MTYANLTWLAQQVSFIFSIQYDMLLASLTNATIRSRIPEIQHFVFGQDYESVKSRIDQISGTYLFIDYGDIDSTRDKNNSISDTVKMAATIACKISSKSDLVEQAIVSSYTLQLAKQFRALMLRDQSSRLCDTIYFHLNKKALSTNPHLKIIPIFTVQTTISKIYHHEVDCPYCGTVHYFSVIWRLFCTRRRKKEGSITGLPTWAEYASASNLESEWGFDDESIYFQALDPGTQVTIQYLSRKVGFRVKEVGGNNVLEVIPVVNGSLKIDDILHVHKIKKRNYTESK